MAWTFSGNIKGASGSPGASGSVGATGATGASGASGVPGASGASGAAGAGGVTSVNGATGAIENVLTTTNTVSVTNKTFDGTNTFPARRSVSTLTSPTTLGASGNTDYVAFLSYASDDASITSVSTLLHCEGANNSTTITDSALSPVTWTANGAAKISTGRSKFGSASLLLDATTNCYLSAGSTTPFTFGTGDFTIEMFVYVSSNPTTDRGIFDCRPNGTDGAYPALFTYNAGASAFAFTYYTNAANRINSSASFSYSTWYHLALCRSGTSTKMFVDGTQVGSTYTDSTNYGCGASRPLIGSNAYTAGTNQFNGNLDEIRVTKGVARYTSNFTAPTAAFPDYTLGSPTLPTAVGNTNRYTIKNINGSPVPSPITISTTSSQTIDGSTLTVANGAAVNLISDGANWRTGV